VVLEQMDNTLVADASYHAVVIGALGAVAWLTIAFLVMAGRILILVRCMRFVERVVLGLWVGFIAANVAILASALPYIYTQQDPSMKCGSLGIANLALNMIPGSMLAIIILAAFFFGGRACIQQTIRERGPVVGAVVKYAGLLGSLFWVAAAGAGFTTFAWFLESFMIVMPNPPRLPPNLSDSKACSEFIGIASKPPFFDPFGVWFRILR
jgi:hypothetical protein